MKDSKYEIGSVVKYNNHFATVTHYDDINKYTIMWFDEKKLYRKENVRQSELNLIDDTEFGW